MLNDIRKPENNISFSSFLSADYARDYITQDTPYDEQIGMAAKAIREADHVLIGVGAGMSAAAGAEYGGKFFEENFAEFQRVYGKGQYMQDMYSAGFYPFPDEESRWGLWSHLALIAGADLDVTPLHRLLIEATKGALFSAPTPTTSLKKQATRKSRSLPHREATDASSAREAVIRRHMTRWSCSGGWSLSAKTAGSPERWCQDALSAEGR